uniref:cytochrome P450 3A5-like n=1 Tax=Styela clava TaxID=7725 RepID=UPI0019397803|nr:cytochrome P450 3A5-like [Styela clava]
MITPLDILSIETWVLIISLLALGRYYIHRKWQYLKNINIPHEPCSIRKFGHLSYTFGAETALQYDNKCKEKFGNVYGTYFGITPTVHIHDPDILRQIFIKEFSNFAMRQRRFLKISGEELNNSLTNVDLKQWKRMRNTLTPTFSSAKLRQMTTIMEWCADNAIVALNKKVENNGGVFNSKDFFSRISLDVVCSAAFSTKVDSINDTENEPEIVKKAKELMKGGGVLSKLFVLLIVLSEFLEKVLEKLNIPLVRGESLKYFRRLTDHVIEKRKNNPHDTGRVDLMQLMLDAEISPDKVKEGAEKGLTKIEIIGNSMLMIMAGYQNTGNLMSWTSFNFARHPEIQAKVQEEIDEMIKTHGKLDYDGINGLKFLDMCINETLRLYTPIIRNARIAERETTINGLTIPAGLLVAIPVYGLAHDPDYWDEPFAYKPERMRDMSQIDPMMFQPFGAGPRNCIGLRFALIEVKMALAKILHQFTIKPAENTPEAPMKFKFTNTLAPAVNFDLKVEPRNVAE